MHAGLEGEGAAVFVEGAADEVGGYGGGGFAGGELFEIFEGASGHDAVVLGCAHAGADGYLCVVFIVANGIID